MRALIALFLIALQLAYVQVASAQTAAAAAAYELFAARVMSFAGGTIAFSTTGAALVSTAAPVFSAPTFSTGGAAVATAARVAVGTGTAAMTVTAGITGAEVLTAVRLLAMGGTGVVGIGLTALAMHPMVTDYFATAKTRLGDLSVRGTDKPFEHRFDASGTVYKVDSSNLDTWYPSPGSAASAYAVEATSNLPTQTILATVISATETLATFNRQTCYKAGSGLDGQCSGNTTFTAYVSKKTGMTSGPWTPATWDDIAPYMDKPSSPAEMQALLNAGAKFEVTPRFINGPEYVPLPSTKEVTETPEKTTTKETAKSVKLEYSTKTDPVTGKPVPVVKAIPTETVTVTEKDKATGVEKVISTTTTTTPGSKPAAEPQDIETCGLPGKPKCLIDETGTPVEVDPSKYDSKLDDYKTKQGELKDKVSGNDDKSFFSNWSGVFVTPPLAACSVYTLPRSMGEIDPCPVVDGVRNVMAYIWAITALWLSLGMIRRVV